MKPPLQDRARFDRGGRRPAWRRAFTLAEVAIATGLIAVSLTTLLTIMSLGTANSRESAERTNAGLLFDTIVSQLSLKPLTVAQTADGQGQDPARLPLPALNEAGAVEVFFVDERNRFVSRLGETAGDLPREATKVVRVQITDPRPLPDANLADPRPAASGQLGSVRVEIGWPATSYDPQRGRARHRMVFHSELSQFEP